MTVQVLLVVTYVTNGTITDKRATLNDSNEVFTSPTASYFLKLYRWLRIKENMFKEVHPCSTNSVLLAI